MKKLEIGDRCEVYRVDCNILPWEPGDFKEGSWSIGVPDSSWLKGRNVYHNSSRLHYATKEMITPVGCLIIKQLKNIG